MVGGVLEVRASPDLVVCVKCSCWDGYAVRVGHQSDVEEDDVMLIFQRSACGPGGPSPDVSRLGGRLSRGGIGVVLTLAIVFVSGIVCADARAAEACPNEALRQELRSGALPDCRAYEMVTPVYGAGGRYDLLGFGSIPGVSVSTDGSHIITGAVGGFAETQSDTFQNAEYELSRSGSGWMVSALAPPASMSPESVYLGSSRDLTRTLWNMHGASQSIYENYLYVRESDGRFVEMGPLQPVSYGSGPASGTSGSLAGRGDGHAQYDLEGGSSADLSHVIFAVQGENNIVGDLWPGDTTLGENGVNSLYQYAGTGLARPELVGVNNEGENITQCGTLLGGENDKYNAVSASGNTIFFTALPKGCTTESKGPAVSELYARVNGQETIKISEPFESQCGSCRTGDSQITTTETGARFAGASEDGSKVFFTTEQELLAGQTTTNLYEYDFGNSRSGAINPAGNIVLVSSGSAAPEVQGVARVSEDGSHVYFVARGVLSGENGEHDSPTLGADNLYVFERDTTYPHGRIGFIAELCSEVDKSGVAVDALCHGSDAANWGSGDSRPVQATPDGRFVVFTSAGDLTVDDTSTVDQVFEYDAQEEKLVRVSTGFENDGNTETDPASIIRPNYMVADLPSEAISNLTLSNDGAYVFFTSAAELTEGAKTASEAGSPSLYEYHSSGRSIANGGVHLISDGKDTTKSVTEAGIGIEFLGTTASGRDAFFLTGDPLLPARDLNTARDVYDARIDGGFPEPMGPSSCEGEACQGAAFSSSSLSRSPGSMSALAGGNVTGVVQPKPPGVRESDGSPQARRLSRAQQLAKALKGCRRLPKRKRAICETQARKRYGAKFTRAAAGRGR